jgi:hypothetical protein
LLSQFLIPFFIMGRKCLIIIIGNLPDYFIKFTYLFYLLKTTIYTALLYFLLSTLLTWWFIAASPLYITPHQMFLSCGIAGGKWAIQLLAAFFLLTQEKKWKFIHHIAYTCFIGSMLLTPYAISSAFNGNTSSNFFIGSLIVSVITMIFLYYLSTKKAGVALGWWWGWLICLATAVTLQLTVVFDVI